MAGPFLTVLGGAGMPSESSYDDLKAALFASGEGSVGEIVNKSDKTKRIALLELVSKGASVALSTFDLLGAANFANVTASQYGTIASGSGTAYVLTAGHSMPASGTLRPWNIASASEPDNDVAFTVAGNNLTLATSSTIGVGDLVYTLDVSEFEVGSASDVRPQAGCSFSFDGSGAVATGGIAKLACYPVTNAGAFESPTVWADVSVSASDTSGDAALVGVIDAASTVAAGFGWAWAVGTQYRPRCWWEPTLAGGSTVGVASASPASQISKISGSARVRGVQSGTVTGHLVSEAAQTVTTDGQGGSELNRALPTGDLMAFIATTGAATIKVSSLLIVSA